MKHDATGEQLAKRFRVTVVLTIVPSAIGSMILAIFAAFGRPDIGAILVGILFVPIVVAAWLEYASFRRKVRSPLRPQSSLPKNEAPPV